MTPPQVRRRIQVNLIDIVEPQLKRRSKADYARKCKPAKNIHERTHQLKDRINRLANLHEAIRFCRLEGKMVKTSAILEYLTELHDIRLESALIYQHRLK